MRSTMTIDLADESELDSAGIDDRTRFGWWIEGERVTVRTGHSISVYRLPKAARRITMMKLGACRSQLAIGGFTFDLGCGQRTERHDRQFEGVRALNPQELYDDLASRCGRVITLARVDDTDQAGSAVGAMVLSSNLYSFALEVGIGPEGDGYALIRGFDPAGNPIAPVVFEDAVSVMISTPST